MTLPASPTVCRFMASDCAEKAILAETSAKGLLWIGQARTLLAHAAKLEGSVV